MFDSYSSPLSPPVANEGVFGYSQQGRDRERVPWTLLREFPQYLEEYSKHYSRTLSNLLPARYVNLLQYPLTI